MYGNLYVRANPKDALSAFASAVYDALGVTRVEERSSAHYVGETYFLGTALGMTLCIAEADEEGFEEYRFWLSLERDGPAGEDDGYLESCGDAIARILTARGYSVCGAPSSGRAGKAVRVRYVLKSSDGPPIVEAVVEA